MEVEGKGFGGGLFVSESGLFGVLPGVRGGVFGTLRD